MKYFIIWNYGNHHSVIETKKDDYDNIINTLSKEFQIHITNINYDKHKQNIVFWIENYYDEKEIIGYITK